MQTLTSSANPSVRRVHRLQRQARQRRAAERFCIETPRDLSRALAAGFECAELYALADVFRSQPDVSALAESVSDCFTVPEHVLDKLSYRQNPAGFVAVMIDRRAALADLPRVEAGCYLICAGLEKPGNLGAILRSADASGCDGVLIDSPGVDLYNPNCIRASTGAVFTQPIVCAPRDAIASWADEQGVQRLVATPEADRDVDAIDLTGPVAWVLGSEAEGVDAWWRDRAGAAAAIPMRGRSVDSLNVSVTAALLLYETMRQRRAVSD